MTDEPLQTPEPESEREREREREKEGERFFLQDIGRRRCARRHAGGRFDAEGFGGGRCEEIGLIGRWQMHPWCGDDEILVGIKVHTASIRAMDMAGREQLQLARSLGV